MGAYGSPELSPYNSQNETPDWAKNLVRCKKCGSSYNNALENVRIAEPPRLVAICSGLCGFFLAFCSNFYFARMGTWRTDQQYLCAGNPKSANIKRRFYCKQMKG